MARNFRNRFVKLWNIRQNIRMILKHECYGISPFDSNAMKSSNPHSGIYEASTSRTLDLNGGNPVCNQGGVCVVEIMQDEDEDSTVGNPKNQGGATEIDTERKLVKVR